METAVKTKTMGAVKMAAEREREVLQAKYGVKSRGVWGIWKGKVHYNADEDVFNLGF